MKKPALIVVAVVMLTTVACSSTNQTDIAERSDATTAGRDAAGNVTKAADARDSTGSRRSSQNAGAGSDATDATAPGGRAQSRAGLAPTGGKLKLGVHLSANAAAASAFGVTLPQHSPDKVNAILRWINANGGIAGRKVEAVYHTTDPLRGSFDQQAQETCTALTQDHKVDYAISAAQLYRDTLPACFAQNRTPFVWDVYYLTQRSVVPVEYLYRPAQPHSDRMGFIIDGLVRHGFFRGARIGLLRYDSPKEKRVADTVFKPALASHGLKVTEEFAVREPLAASEASDSAAELSNAALRFRQQRISHVIFVPSGGAIPLLFLAAVESQNYRPKYGLSSADAPYFVRDSVPPAQLEGAVGVGWAPTVDLGPTSVEAQKALPGTRLCVDIARKAGYPPDQTPFLYCDMLFFLRAALANAAATTIDSLRNGTALASGYDSSVTYATKFSPGRHDGTASARTFVWDGDWKYVGSQYAVR